MSKASAERRCNRLHCLDLRYFPNKGSGWRFLGEQLLTGTGLRLAFFVPLAAGRRSVVGALLPAFSGTSAEKEWNGLRSKDCPWVLRTQNAEKVYQRAFSSVLYAGHNNSTTITNSSPFVLSHDAILLLVSIAGDDYTFLLDCVTSRTCPTSACARRSLLSSFLLSSILEIQPPASSNQKPSQRSLTSRITSNCANAFPDCRINAVVPLGGQATHKPRHG